MTPERIAELRSVALYFSENAGIGLAFYGQCDATNQCLDEIERLRGWLWIILNGSTDYTAVQDAFCALDGQVVPK